MTLFRPHVLPPTPSLLDVAWQARPEDAAACARRFARMQENLSRCDPLVRRWYEIGATAEAARRPLPLAPSSLTRRFEEARLPQRGTDQDQGFDLVAWNGEQGPCHTSLLIQAGSDRTGEDWLNDMSNNVGIVFEPAEAANADLLTVDTLKPILLALIDAWEPATGNMRPLHLLDQWAGDPPAVEQFRFHGGWMTYLAAPWCHEIEPPPGAILEATPDGGLLMIATAEPFDLQNPDHVEAATAIHEALAPLWLDLMALDL
jgi:hypothetical protein